MRKLTTRLKRSTVTFPFKLLIRCWQSTAVLSRAKYLAVLLSEFPANIGLETLLTFSLTKMGCIVYQKGLYYKSREEFIHMGYRSDVILAVGPEVMPQFMVTMAKSPQARELCWADHDEMIRDYNDEKGAFLFRWTVSSGTIVMSACKPFKTLLIGARTNALKLMARKLMRVEVITASSALVKRWMITRQRVGF